MIDAPKVTERQLQVWRGIVEGHTDRKMAADFGISIWTVCHHREELYRRIGCNCVAQCTRLAIRWGVIRERVLR